ncbi:FkbM family methyltransferase [Mucilaginibacter frigoritolerans]|uniref:FkbM family methyltransferase n=1 Tax=Mucilaginibacter frigoritolerans TaxID=652788 RepID=A0A562U0N7_9SPHI|nr:FkbM family methyltransferase [Mucilaginibacter frigoritolerans]TWI99243.1 FkbM family methyltransferase [Mucilaginibacter frigoritolerans]
MKRTDRIKLDFTRNWTLPGKARLSRWFKPSDQLKSIINNGIVWLNNEDIAIYANTNNYIEWTILSSGTYEDEINKLIRVSLKNGENALDIGGNIGLQSIRMSQCVGSTGKVFAFEPLNHLQQKFTRNMLLNKAANVKLFPFALADEEGEADFTIDTNSWNQGTFSLTGQNQGTEKQHVFIKVADNIQEVQDLTSLALIKIDVEGFEFQVLKGLKQTLQKHRPRIIFEYDYHYWLKTGLSIEECCSFLESFGYQFYQITPVGCELISNITEIEGGNLFCIPIN